MLQPEVVALAGHFPNLGVQKHAARMGMWLFLTTEILLFGGLFCAYSYYRFLYPETFAAASRHMHTYLGLVNTVVLVTSSLTVALGHHAATQGKARRAGLLFLGSVLFGFAFLGIKAVEYAGHWSEGALPGKYYTFEAVQLPGASLFYGIYFLMTGLHGLHVVIGMGVLVWAASLALRGRISASYYTPVELAGLYWHLVDLVWIFLFPLLYLI